MIVFECTPNSLADRAQEYETLKFNYEGVEIVANYREKKAEAKQATKACFAEGIYVRDVVGSISECSPESFDNLSKKCARHFADICDGLFKSEKPKQDKQLSPNYDKEQAAKTWETKVRKYEALLGDKWAAAFTPPSEERRIALLARMKNASLEFDQSYVALKKEKESNEEFKKLAKAFKEARKGSSGLMTLVAANRTELQRNWEVYTKAMRQKGVSEKLINQIGEKAGVKESQ